MKINLTPRLCRLIPLIGLACGSQGRSQTDDWVQVGTAADGGRYYVRSSVIAAAGPNSVTFWAKADLSQVSSTKDRMLMSRYTIDCQKQTFRVLARTTYAADGHETSSYLPSYALEQPMVPDTMVVVFARSVCANFVAP